MAQLKTCSLLASGITFLTKKELELFCWESYILQQNEEGGKRANFPSSYYTSLNLIHLNMNPMSKRIDTICFLDWNGSGGTEKHPWSWHYLCHSGCSQMTFFLHSPFRWPPCFSCGLILVGVTHGCLSRSKPLTVGLFIFYYLDQWPGQLICEFDAFVLWLKPIRGVYVKEKRSMASWWWSDSSSDINV